MRQALWNGLIRIFLLSCTLFCERFEDPIVAVQDNAGKWLLPIPLCVKFQTPPCLVFQKDYAFHVISLCYIYTTEAVAKMCSLKKVFLNILQNSQENICARVPFLLKKRHWYRCFPLNFAKFLGTPFLKEHLRWLLLILP